MEKQISKRLTEGKYEVDGRLLTNSGFNLSWFDYFNVTPSLIVDVGAFDFGDSVRFKKRFPLCQVYSYELDEDNYVKHHEYAQSVGVITSLAAVCDEDYYIEGYWKAKNKSHHENAQGSLLEPTEEYKSRYPYITHEYTPVLTSSTRLDVEFNCQIDLLHIDVEGGELKVLKGLGELRPKLVWIEYLVDGGWEGQNFKDVDEWFLSRNYICEVNDWPDKLWVNNNL